MKYGREDVAPEGWAVVFRQGEFNLSGCEPHVIQCFAACIMGGVMAKSFSNEEWSRILAFASEHAEEFGLPQRRGNSVIIGSFNIRKLGSPDRSEGSWRLLSMICERFDLLAVQEVLDDLSGIRHLKRRLGDSYGLVVSDTTGAYPSSGTAAERLAFLFRWQRVARTEVASDISYDRTKVADTLFSYRDAFWEAMEKHAKDMENWTADTEKRRAEGKKARPKPTLSHPHFLTFIRQPLCVSFEIKDSSTTNPVQFLAVNCHLLYGDDPRERRREFEALVAWLIERAKHQERMYYPNLLLLGDCNLEFDDPETERPKIDAFLKSLNEDQLGKRGNAEINFPLLDVHPSHTDVFRTNARLKETYDQIAVIFRDKRLPSHEANKKAGSTADGFDYGVFNFVELFSQALYEAPFAALEPQVRKQVLGKFEHDLTDHLPVWIRLPMPD